MLKVESRVTSVTRLFLSYVRIDQAEFRMVCNCVRAFSSRTALAISMLTTRLPTGHKEMPASLKDWMPKGMPMMVMQLMMPAMM